MNKFAVFDVDGTLIRWQLYHAVVDKLARAGALGEQALEDLHGARMIWKRREHAEAFKTYEVALIKVYEAALGTISTQLFDQLVQEVIAEYKDQAYTYTRDLIRSLKKQGYLLLAISGSHQELVAEIAKHYGFDDCIGTRYQRAKGTFNGQKFIASRNKKALLEQLVKKHNLSFSGSLAIGDSASDIPMLEVVERPIAFNPDQTLFETAKQNGWQIIIERKNVVYKLEDRHGTYVLA